MAKKKGNKDLLKSVNYSLETVKKIQEGLDFSIDEKQQILTDFVGLSEDNNSYYTPDSVCDFICDTLDIKGDAKVCDLSGGIGSMAKSLILEYGKLKDNVQFDLYELDPNTSIAAAKAWEDYGQVNYVGNVDTLALDIEENKYDYCIGNPPFSGSVEYTADWNIDGKGKVKKKNDIVNAFIDKSFKVTKEGGYVALVLPGGFVSKGNSTEKLREYISERYDLKLVMDLLPDAFVNSGLKGTTVGTTLIIWQKCKSKNNKTILVELHKDEDLLKQFKSISYYFKVVQGEHYILMNHSANDMSYGILKEGIDPDAIGDYEEDDEGDIECYCYCCNSPIYEGDLESGYTYTKKDTGDEVGVCFECSNDELMYIDKIKRDLLIDGEELTITASDKKTLTYLRKEKARKEEEDRLDKLDKEIYIFTNKQRQTVQDDMSPMHSMKMCQQFQKCTDDNVVKVKIPFRIGIEKHFKNTLRLEYIDLSVDNLRIEHYRAKKPGEKEWNDRERHIYRGYIKTSCDLYDTSFGIFYYPHDKKCSVYVNYNFICSLSYPMKNLIVEHILPELLGSDIVLY